MLRTRISLRGLLLLLAGAVILLLLLRQTPQTFQVFRAQPCERVYLDLGTNVGVQIRKLYEPHLFPNARILPYFRKYFGNNTEDVCTFGFEPNPAHALSLRQLARVYNKKGWRVTIMEKAVSDTNGILPFKREPSDQKNNEWGARLGKSGEKDVVNVHVINFAEWFATEIALRRTASGTAPTIVMKVDIEGHDTTVLSSLILRGQYCSFTFIYVEHVTESFLNSTRVIQERIKNCSTTMIRLDDESYHNSKFPLPEP